MNTVRESNGHLVGSDDKGAPLDAQSCVVDAGRTRIANLHRTMNQCGFRIAVSTGVSGDSRVVTNVVAREKRVLSINERLVEAAKTGKLEEVQRLVDQGADVNEGEIPSFLWAYFNGHAEVCKWLLSTGGNVNHDGFSEMTLLMAATVQGDVAFMSFLIDAGADVNLPLPAGGETALHKAAVRNQPEAMQLLIERGGDVNRRTKVGGETAMDAFATVWGETPLHIASVAGDERVIKILLDSGADKSIRTSQGKTAFDYAVENQRDPNILEAVRP